MQKSENWPSSADVEDAEDCGNSQLCLDLFNGYRLRIHLHNTVHIIVGIGHFYNNLSSDQKGVMADTAASPNDPLFISHHAMVDCILEEWLQRNPNGRYPDVPEDIKGHQREGYIVPFFPLYKHSDMFMTADNFGYTCDIDLQQRGVAIPALCTPFQCMAFIAMCSTALLIIITKIKAQ